MSTQPPSPPEEPQQPRPPVVPQIPTFKGAAAEARAQQLGIPKGTQLLVQSLQDGASAAKGTVRGLHPRVYEGERMWGEAVASLRWNLRPTWVPETVRGVDLTVHPHRGIAIIVTAGDSATGHENHVPDVRYERREVIQALVNGSIDTLWGPTERPEWQIWFLLHFLHKSTLTGELARPSYVGSNGRVSSWLERILFPTTDLGPGAKVGPVEDSPPAIDVDVKRRAV